MDITPVIQAVTVLLAAIITTFVVPYIKNKTTAAQQSQINAWVKIAGQQHLLSGNYHMQYVGT